jgi:MFS family permease
LTAGAAEASRFPTSVVAGLAYCMSTGGIARATVPVLSSLLIADLDISASEFGFSVTIMIGMVAIGVPLFGQLTDRLGARAVLVFRGGGAGAALVGVSMAQGYGWLLLFQAVLGFVIAGGVPASNRVVAETVPHRYRGLAIGLKQSGATMGVLVAGITIPAIAGEWGWRWSIGVAGCVSMLTIPAVLLLIPRSGIEAPKSGSGRASWGVLLTNRSTRWLSAHGFVSGIGISMVFAFLPLYAVEEVGLSPAAAGGVLSLMSMMAIAARISWGRVSDMSGDVGKDLRRISILSVVAVGLIASAASIGSWVLWTGAALAGLSMEAWNSLAGSGIISAVPIARAGRASSVVQMAFMAGNATGPVLFGAIVDVSGTFTLGWVICGVVFFFAAVVRYRPAGRSTDVESSEVVHGVENG